MCICTIESNCPQQPRRQLLIGRARQIILRIEGFTTIEMDVIYCGGGVGGTKQLQKVVDAPQISIKLLFCSTHGLISNLWRSTLCLWSCICYYVCLGLWLPIHSRLTAFNQLQAMHLLELV